MACTPTGPEAAVTAAVEAAVTAEPETVEPKPETVEPETVEPAVEPETVEPETVEPETVEPADDGAPEIERLTWVEPGLPSDPNAQPKFDVIARKIAEEDADEGMCPFEVVFGGFPAISEDGTILVDAHKPKDRGASDTSTELTWHRADGVKLVHIYNPHEQEPDAETPEDAELDDCNDSLAKVRSEVSALNDELSARKWRQLERLDVVYSKPGWSFRLCEAEPDEVIEGLAGADRPVEILYHAGHFIARVAGLRVLQKTSQPAWRQAESPSCPSDGQIHEMKVDRASKLALVYYNFSSASCLCDERQYVGRIELAPEVFAAVETRSTAKFRPALELAWHEALYGDGE